MITTPNLPPLVGTLAAMPDHHKKVIEAYGEACSRVAYAAGRDADQWQPIETAPKDGAPILLRSRSGRIADGFWGVRYGVWSWPYVMTEPAYWMPLPKPPALKSDAKGGA